MLCNAGQDTLSLARLGAQVTGIDISESAVDFALMNIYEWFAEAAHGLQRFDLAFCSYGVLCWLSDVQAWAKGIASIFTPGGLFVLIDYHPLARMFRWDLRRLYAIFLRMEHPSPLSRDWGLCCAC